MSKVLIKNDIVERYGKSSCYSKDLLCRLYDFLYQQVGKEKIEIVMHEWVESRDLLQFELGGKGVIL